VLCVIDMFAVCVFGIFLCMYLCVVNIFVCLLIRLCVWVVCCVFLICLIMCVVSEWFVCVDFVCVSDVYVWSVC